MRDPLRVDTITGFFISLVLVEKPTRGEMAELLKGIRDKKKKLHFSDYLELSKRTRAIVDNEMKWRKRKDWEREMATMWGPSLQ